jgi:uncharacterized protein (DUF1684 family)
MHEESVSPLLDLADWRRRTSDLYHQIRASDDPTAAWKRWREVRDELFLRHPQSPIPIGERSSFDGLRYFDYEPAFRVTAEVVGAEPQEIKIDSSGDEPFTFTRFARAEFALSGSDQALDLLWLHGYAGGLFLSFRDSTSGDTTYGACRYLLDTAKGADLGVEDSRLVLDFNFSYQPSCSYDPRWVCPLAPPSNRLPMAVEAGERL